MSRPLLENPLRSLLFVPGNNRRMTEKALGTGADGVILDLEDAVPDAAKVEARETVRKALADIGDVQTAAFVRINDWSTPYWEADVKAVVGKNLQGIVLPKSESIRAISSVERLLRQREKVTALSTGSVRLFLSIESAQGLLKLPELVGFSERIAGVIFGAEDFCLDTGISRIPDGNELLYPRSYLAICTRAYGCGAIDTIYPDLNDPDGLRRECERAKQLGFSGKLAIHPKQIDTIHAAFSPSEQEVSEALKILEVFKEAQANGQGVALLGGKMIDRPVAERARRIINRTEALAKKLSARRKG